MTVSKRGRYWAVWDAGGELVCFCVDRRGAREVMRRLAQQEGERNRSETTRRGERH